MNRALGEEAGDEIVCAHHDGSRVQVELELLVRILERTIAVLEVMLDGVDVVGAVNLEKSRLVHLLEELG